MDERDDLVSDEFADRLQRTCRTAVGDSLRSITYFTPRAYAQVYLRSDLEADADLAGFVEHETLGFRARTAYRGSELGEYEHTVRSFENGYVTRVTADGAGVFVTTDGLTMRRSEEVAAALSHTLRDE
ncbi:DUF7522 family protein [Halegenticoccus tardaugens]|uniref:DUF7522 family protein n=1 Tax=Halegenticoccus tardaugens TaxID=2071624 RepID=UPI00100BCA20|nr:hypothetical protein [Halegenticoccus tardaugens]